jgi:predicted TIM-barrel fold metal-dependent hydrolase
MTSSPKYDYIDMHVHLGVFYHGKEVTVDGLLRWMDAHRVERAVIQPLVSPEATIYLQTTEAALAAHQAHPDRLIPFCAIDPRAAKTAASTYPPLPASRGGHVAGVRGLVDVLKRWRDAGARGFGEHKVGLPFDHPVMMMLYEACREVGFPLLFHLDDIRGLDEPGLPHLERALSFFPEVVFIGHAAGFWSSISGDANPKDFQSYPRRPTTPGGALDRLMNLYPNLYGDLSAPSGENAIRRNPEFGRKFIIRRADQLVFGTDYLMPGQKIPQFELLESLNLPDEVRHKIYRANAIRLLKLNTT